MKSPIRYLAIENFKTAKNLKFDCKRINLIIGKPNVGKSNVLEAISLLGGSYSTNYDKYFSPFIRYDRIEDLFYDKETHNSIFVKSNIGSCIIKDSGRGDSFLYFLSSNDAAIADVLNKTNDPGIEQLMISAWSELQGHQSKLPSFGRNLDLEGRGNSNFPSVQWHSPVKKYEFQKYVDIKDRFHFFLLPPYGNNLFAIVNRNKKFFKEISSFFKEYKLQFKLIPRTTEFLLQKDIKGVIYEYQYNLIADTLQRIIFYLMAIASNSESVLIFEEPETHSFPRYTKLLAEKIIEARQNQFFISTHSPFILNTIIENAPLEDVAVFIATYENFQTKLKPLSQKELEEMLNYGNDIFFSEKLNG